MRDLLTLSTRNSNHSSKWLTHMGSMVTWGRAGHSATNHITRAGQSSWDTKAEGRTTQPMGTVLTTNKELRAKGRGLHLVNPPRPTSLGSLWLLGSQVGEILDSIPSITKNKNKPNKQKQNPGDNGINLQNGQWQYLKYVY